MHRPFLVFASDWHIAPSAWVRSGVVGDSYHALSRLVDFCVSRRLPLLGAGDLFDTTDPPPEAVAAVRSQMDRMRDANLEVWYTQGQHEKATTPWLSAIHDWPFHIDGKSATISISCNSSITPLLRLYGLDHRTPSRLQAALASVPPDIDAVVCHQVFSDVMGGQAQCEARLADVPHASLILFGDFHKHIVKFATRDDGTTLTALSSGSICMQSIDEESAKSFFVIGRDADGDLAYESEALPGRYSLRIDLTDDTDFNEFIVHGLAGFLEDAASHATRYALPPDIVRPLLGVRYDPAMPDALIRITAACRDVCHVMTTPIVTADIASERSVMASLRSGGMLAVLADMDLSIYGVDESLRRTVASLLSAADPEVVLSEILG